MRARILFNEEARSKTTSTRHRRRAGLEDDTVGFFYLTSDLDDDDETVEYGPDIATIVAMLTRKAEDEVGEDA